jgi:DNA-binding transcriptional regulator YdaS (Cro superfamily)
MGLRLKGYLKDLGIDEGETMHGIRGGCAITLMSKGIVNPEEVMQHVGWFSMSSLDRYSQNQIK